MLDLKKPGLTGPPYYPKQNSYYGYYQQNVNESASMVSQKTDQPGYNEYHGNDVQ
jgi:hypothetical protein